jgi:hypothetical protein
MSIEIIQERRRVTQRDYSLEFRRKDDPNAGFTFPCDKDGNPMLDECNTKSYLYATQEHPERYGKPFIEKRSWAYWEPAVGRCRCGEHVTLQNEYMGACQCPKCGQWYNLFGQELLPPEQWEEVN